MADLPFKINVETKGGSKRSWFDADFATTTETNISASAILSRINAMDSASYSSDQDTPTSIITTRDFNHAENIWLEVSQVNQGDTGSIKFTHTDDEDTADPMKRYRFFGTKVCNVLGLPEGQWIYPENFHLDETGGSNYFSGDVAATSLSLTHGMTMANTATVRSNLRFGITDTLPRPDLFVQFTTGSGALQSNALLLGYNAETNKYVLDKGDEDNLYINATSITGSILTTTHIKNSQATRHDNYIQFNADTIYHYCAGTLMTTLTGGVTPSSVEINELKNDVDFKIHGDTISNLFFVDASTDRVGIGTNTIPRGSVGYAKFAIHGAGTSGGSAAGPHIQYTTEHTNYPLFQQLNWTHNNISMCFDSYYDGAWRSSHSDSNFQIYKYNDVLRFRVDESITAGNAISWNNALCMDATGSVGIGTAAMRAPLYVYSDTNNTKVIFDTGADIHTYVTLDCGNGTTNRNAQLGFKQNGSSYWGAGMFALDFKIQNSAAGNVNPFVIENGANDLSLYIEASGEVGIGTASPSQKLDVNGSVRMRSFLRDSNNDVADLGQFLTDDGGGVVWDIPAGGFTGQHRSQPTDNTLQNYSSSIDDFIGKIVVATDGYMNKYMESGSAAITINDAWTNISLANTYKDKRVYGVINGINRKRRIDLNKVDEEQSPSSSYHPSVVTGSDGKPVYDEWIGINSIGEGAVWVCNISGSLESGDLITTSAVSGYGVKQEDDLFHNYTLGKMTMDCNFSGSGYVTGSVTHNSVTYKTAFVGCTYHCG